MSRKERNKINKTLGKRRFDLAHEENFRFPVNLQRNIFHILEFQINSEKACSVNLCFFLPMSSPSLSLLLFFFSNVKFNCLHLSSMTCKVTPPLSHSYTRLTWFGAFRCESAGYMSTHTHTSQCGARSLSCSLYTVFGRQRNLTNPQNYPLFYHSTNTHIHPLLLLQHHQCATQYTFSYSHHHTHTQPCVLYIDMKTAIQLYGYISVDLLFVCMYIQKKRRRRRWRQLAATSL